MMQVCRPIVAGLNASLGVVAIMMGCAVPVGTDGPEVAGEASALRLPTDSCAGDLNGDGIVDGADLATVLGAWGTYGSHGDANGDGKVDSRDMRAILVGWGFCPQADFECGETMIDPRDGREYSTRLYGTDCWMTQNLNHGELVISDQPGSLMPDDGIVQRYCYNNNPVYCDHDGALYEWAEAVGHTSGSHGDPSGVQGVCPPGWHLPSDAEWQDLERSVGMSEADVQRLDEWRGEGIGTFLKQGGGSAFEARLVGWRSAVDGSFNDRSDYGGWWTARLGNENPETAFNRGVARPRTTVDRRRYANKTGLAVRCMWNTDTPLPSL